MGNERLLSLLSADSRLASNSNPRPTSPQLFPKLPLVPPECQRQARRAVKLELMRPQLPKEATAPRALHKPRTRTPAPSRPVTMIPLRMPTVMREKMMNKHPCSMTKTRQQPNETQLFILRLYN